jgi:hypothetical protein
VHQGLCTHSLAHSQVEKYSSKLRCCSASLAFVFTFEPRLPALRMDGEALTKDRNTLKKDHIGIFSLSTGVRSGFGGLNHDYGHAKYDTAGDGGRSALVVNHRPHLVRTP